MFLPAALLSAVLGSAGAAQAPDVQELVSRAAKYALDYEARLGALVSEEDYDQDASWDSGASVTRSRRQHRHLFSDFLSVRVGDGRITVRDVRTVDGKPIDDKRLRPIDEILEKPHATTLDRIRELAERSAQFNIGEIVRTINLPTFALKVLAPEQRSRFEFRLGKRDKLQGTAVWIVRFEELIGPTLVRGEKNENVISRGRLWIEPETGTIFQTELSSGTLPQPQATMTVRYENDANLEMLVPVEMRERYANSRRHSITGVARYARFRRFEVEVRIGDPR